MSSWGWRLVRASEGPGAGQVKGWVRDQTRTREEPGENQVRDRGLWGRSEWTFGGRHAFQERGT